MDGYTLLIVVMIVSTFVTCAWVMTGFFFRMAVHASYQWALCNILIALQVGLYSWRGTWPNILTYQLSDLATVLSMLFLRRGIQSFAEVKYSDKEQFLLAFMSYCGIAFARSIPDGQSLAIVSLSLFWSYTFCQCAREGYRYMRTQFGKTESIITISPFILMASLFLIRSLIVFVIGSTQGSDLRASNTFTTIFLMATFVCCILINSSLAGFAISKLISKIRKLSIEDPLTKIANRRHIESVLDSELKRCERNKSCFSLVTLDVDHFKKVNDTYGHPAGDAALVLIAGAVKKAMRGSDHVGRIGGEEFCPILPETDAAGAHIAAERMRAFIESEVLVWEDKRILLTASSGVVTYRGSQVSSSDLFKRADEAMYRAKTDGRNRVVSA